MSRTLIIALALLSISTFASAQARKVEKPAADANAEARLDYRQEKDLKDTIEYIEAGEGVAKQLDEKTKDWKVGDANLNAGTIKNYSDSTADALRRIGFAEDRFKKLPKDHAKVKPEIERAAAAKKSLEAHAAKLKQFTEGAGKIAAQGETADYKADFDRLKDINQMFADDQLIQRRPDAAIEVVKQIPNVKEERKRIAEKYADLLKQETGASTQMKSTLAYFDDVFGRFDKAATDYAQSAPAEIDAVVAKALAMSDEAVKEQKHLFFKSDGGIAQQLNEAQTRYEVLAAVKPDDPATAAAKKKIEDARAKVKEAKASLNDSIIAANTIPADQYNGPDKTQLVDLVKTKWASNGVAGDVLKMGINSNSWQRTTRWEYANKSWSKVDTSWIQGFVVVKADDKIANVYHVNLVKDHLADDKIEAHNFDDPRGERDVGGKILLSNVK